MSEKNPVTQEAWTPKEEAVTKLLDLLGGDEAMDIAIEAYDRIEHFDEEEMDDAEQADFFERFNVFWSEVIEDVFLKIATAVDETRG